METRTGKEVIITIVIIILGVLIFSGYISTYNDTTYTVTITDKERNSDSSTYLIWADDEYGNSLVFENTDTFWRMKFNSSNVQGALKEGKTYKITVVGVRVPIFSWYQNIISYEEVLVE